ncbi:MAG: hypothetical protein LBE21_00855 [Pseudomonadales bacterium]|jgi:hypothetical protein|nr:hypothetical protein [Pseudomonadales bacterium]
MTSTIETNALSQQIEELSKRIEAHTSNLNKEAVWLFIATLGVWGVTEKFLQFIAVLTTLIIFISRVVVDPNQGSFYKQIKIIKKTIKNLDISDEIKKTLELKLDSAKSNLGIMSIFGKNQIYTIAFAFLISSFAAWFKP